MSITIFPSSVEVNPFATYGGAFVNTTDIFLERTSPTELKKVIDGDKPIYSSFVDIEVTPTVARTNGFVHAAYQAYSSHHHLRLRPEDIWFSVLSQLSVYINEHAEELRSIFVSHEGKQKVTVEAPGMSLAGYGFGKLAVELTKKMDKYIHDKEWRGWFLPNFTTTTDVDTATAAVLMMGTMQNYFEYSMTLICGLPSVTLLGEKEDWVEIRRRLNKISVLGKEPEEFAERLKVVLDWFIRSFDDPEDELVKSFWAHIVSDEQNGSGSNSFSGWITAFCYWSEGGKPIAGVGDERGLLWQGTKFHQMDMKKIPAGSASVPVNLLDMGSDWKARLTAGSVGMAVTSSESHVGDEGVQRTKEEEPVLDTLQPVSGWFLYKVKG